MAFMTAVSLSGFHGSGVSSYASLLGPVAPHRMEQKVDHVT
jgi:hypothetical protein